MLHVWSLSSGDEEMWRESFRENILAELKRQKMSKAELGRRTDLSRSYVQRVLSGDVESPGLDLLYSMGGALGLGLMDLVPNKIHQPESDEESL